MNSYQLVIKRNEPTAVQTLRNGAIVSIEVLSFSHVDSGGPDGFPHYAWISESFKFIHGFEKDDKLILYRNNVAVDFREVRV